MASKLLSFIEDNICSQCAIHMTEQCYLQDRRNLNLSCLKLKALPPTLTACIFISKLSLNNNSLRFESVVALRSLKFIRYLTLNGNKLTQFPEELCQLKFIEFLNVGDNPIQQLPEAFGKLKNLITLWCNDMQLKQLPSTFGTLQKLKTFGARNNQLSSLPESIGWLRRLKWISLENNYIPEIPSVALIGLTKLCHLNIKGNKFSEIPPELSQLRQLKLCNLANNLIESVQEETLEELRFINVLKLDGNPANISALFSFENLQPSHLRLRLDLSENVIEKEWEHSLPNSELNSPDTSSDESDEMEAYDFQLPKLAKYCCAM